MEMNTHKFAVLLFAGFQLHGCATNAHNEAEAERQLIQDYEKYGNFQCDCSNPNSVTRRMTVVRGTKGPSLIAEHGEHIGCKVVELANLSSHSIGGVTKYLEDENSEIRTLDVCDVRKRYVKSWGMEK